MLIYSTIIVWITFVEIRKYWQCKLNLGTSEQILMMRQTKYCTMFCIKFYGCIIYLYVLYGYLITKIVKIMVKL